MDRKEGIWMELRQMCLGSIKITLAKPICMIYFYHWLKPVVIHFGFNIELLPALAGGEERSNQRSALA